MDRILFSPDNQFVVTGRPHAVQGVPPGLEVWHIASAQRVAGFEGFNFWTISPDSRMVAGEKTLGRVEVVNIATRKEWVSPRGHKANLTAAAFSPNGKLLATTSLDGDARLWEVGTGQPSRVLQGHKAEVHCVTFSPDGRTLVTGGGKGDVKFWSVATGNELLSLRIPGETVRLALFSPDGRTLVFHVTDQPGIDRRGAHLWSPDVRTLPLHDSLHIIRVPSLAEIDAAEKRLAATRPFGVVSP